MSLTTFDQGILTGAFVGLIHQYVRKDMAPPNGAEWLDDQDGNHQPVIIVNLPSNRFVLPVIHAAASEEETARTAWRCSCFPATNMPRRSPPAWRSWVAPSTCSCGRG